MNRRERRWRRGEAALAAELAVHPGAAAGWATTDDRLRALYIDYVGGPWTRGMRRVLARDTALWAALGELALHVQPARRHPVLEAVLDFLPF